MDLFPVHPRTLGAAYASVLPLPCLPASTLIPDKQDGDDIIHMTSDGEHHQSPHSIGKQLHEAIDKAQGPCKQAQKTKLCSTHSTSLNWG